jgi:hypothetical protein
MQINNVFDFKIDYLNVLDICRRAVTGCVTAINQPSSTSTQ